MTRFAIANGNRNFQLNAITWSYRKRGKVPRTQMYKNKKNRIRSANQNSGSTACKSGGPNSGPFHPPRNSNEARHATVIMFAYSAMKNMANFMALYSV